MEIVYKINCTSTNIMTDDDKKSYKKLIEILDNQYFNRSDKDTDTRSKMIDSVKNNLSHYFETFIIDDKTVTLKLRDNLSKSFTECPVLNMMREGNSVELKKDYSSNTCNNIYNILFASDFIMGFDITSDMDVVCKITNLGTIIHEFTIKKGSNYYPQFWYLRNWGVYKLEIDAKANVSILPRYELLCFPFVARCISKRKLIVKFNKDTEHIYTAQFGCKKRIKITEIN